MKKLSKIVAISEIVAALAVIISLIYVGAQIRQNTKATQANTAQSLYEMHSDRIIMVTGDRDLVELKIRAEDPQAKLNAADSLQLFLDLNLHINTYEAAYTNRENGTLEPEMANSWLNGLNDWVCAPVASEYWVELEKGYVQGFANLVNDAFRSNDCR